MRIFYNPRDRKEIEKNEQATPKPVVSTETRMEVKHDGVESEPAGSEEASEAEQTQDETQTATKKAWKKKAETTV